LSGAWRTGEDEMVAHRADGQTGFPAPLIDLDFVDQRPDLGLDAGQPDHRVDPGQQPVQLLQVLGPSGAPAAIPAPSGSGRLAFDDGRIRALVDVDARAGCAVHRTTFDHAAAATPDHDADPVSAVDPAVADRRCALVGNRDAHVTRVGDLAVLQGRSASLV